MRVVEVQRYGGPETLREVERPDPAPAPGRVLVRVAATSVNPVDLWARAGLLTAMTPGLAVPFLLGWDLAGTVLEEAAGFAAGQRVVGFVPWFDVAATGAGTYGEILSAEPEWLAPLPDGLGFTEAATLGLNGPTAAQAVALIAPRAGDTLLVTGASGGVGGFAVELAAAAGVNVVAVAAGADEEGHLVGLGAKQVLPRTRAGELAAVVRAALPDGVDAVFDAALLGQPVIGAVRDGGTFVSASMPAVPTTERGIRVDAVQARPDSAQLRALAESLAAGRLSTRVADVLPLSRAAEAHRRAEARGLRGRLVLTV